MLDRGNNLDIYIDLLERGLIDDEIEAFLSSATSEDVTTELFQCDHCSKSYKTRSGLRRHEKMKHLQKEETSSSHNNTTPPEEKYTLPLADFKGLLEETKKHIMEISYYPEDLKEPIKSFHCQFNDTLYRKSERFYVQLKKYSDCETFHSEMYADIVLNAEKYFLGLRRPHCVIFATKFTEKLQLLCKPLQAVFVYHLYF